MNGHPEPGVLAPGALVSLVEKLKACPTRDTLLTEERLIETWGRFKQTGLEPGVPVTPAILVGLILHEPETYAPLLAETERGQLAMLGRLARERYLQHIHPPNPLGQTLAAAIKESL